MEKPDSLIFDMDGTLWDAVATYTHSWNKAFEELDLPHRVAVEELAKLVGMEGKKATALLMPDLTEEKREEIYMQVNDYRRSVIPQMGGILYDGVKEGLQQLSEKYKLFILSNCAKGIIRLFIDWAGIDEYITDEFAYGVNHMPKSHNIKLLMDKHNLTSPMYVGDTEGDGEQSRLAGLPFVFVTYGFGKTDNYDLKFDNFTDLTQHFMTL
ncbi:HAD family hydrolase [Mucilaginibacter sp. RS28]|uniref:phosphoglycolate phosphatase n=1 Tax=Mucilaginibacter straminoryzae TaxID=2932774 RepID=A0A9X1X3C3_9SPHI|nr:HAD family hydrolase [Mucilaginibacter straminoryzae]MCJ8209320.1 HAD family hydrolase [Mucilaginibacter straminoryzae]